MARTINGNLTGRAAVIHRRDQRESMLDSIVAPDYKAQANDELCKLMDIVGKEKARTLTDHITGTWHEVRDQIRAVNLDVVKLQGFANSITGITALSYGDHDLQPEAERQAAEIRADDEWLGGRAYISGGDVAYIGDTIRRASTDDDMPF